jgi:hypothetical protein
VDVLFALYKLVIELEWVCVTGVALALSGLKWPWWAWVALCYMISYLELFLCGVISYLKWIYLFGDSKYLYIFIILAYLMENELMTKNNYSFL